MYYRIKPIEMKKKINYQRVLLFSIITFSCFSFFYLNQLSSDNLYLEQGFQSFYSENGQVKQFLPDLFIIDNIVDKLKDIITIDF
jgi:hypothetical protein